MRIRLLCCVLLWTVLLCIAGCRPSVQKRPLGFGKLGPVTKFMSPVTDSYKYALLVRHDKRGLYAMSTLCTRDLHRLKARRGKNGPILYCEVCGSEYDGNGKVIKGPAKADLPYYDLFVDAGYKGGPKDTLYVRIGVEVSPDWRLRIHFVETDK